MTAEIVTLQKSNYRDPAAILRVIADDIEAGKFGEVGCVGVVLLGNTMEVFGMGPDSDAPSVGMLLHAGFMRLARSMEDHGKP